MCDKDRVYKLIQMCADPLTTSEDRKNHYLKALEIVRNPSKEKYDGFEDFWRVWPNKVSKALAEKAYQKARKNVTQEVLLSGVQFYIKNKPEYQDYAHASSWLNARRWDDGQIVENHTITRTDWPEWKTKLAGKLGEAQVNAWFRDVEYIEGVFICPTMVVHDWIKNRMAKDMYTAIGSFELTIKEN